MISLEHVRLKESEKPKQCFTRQEYMSQLYLSIHENIELRESISELPNELDVDRWGIPDCFYYTPKGELVFVELKQEGEGCTMRQLEWFLNYQNVYRIRIVYCKYENPLEVQE